MTHGVSLISSILILSTMTKFDIGARVKHLRAQKQLTVRELARRSGVSATQISEIERNLTAPTVPTLMKIVSALGTEVSIFFESKNHRTVSVVRKNERQEFIDLKSNVFIQSLSNGITDTKLKVILAHPPPGVENIRGGYQHPGEELIYVIKGKVQVTIDGTCYILEEGDSVHFRGELRHTIKNITDHEVEVLAIITPPNY
jgi:transcriptional regulator with XRE-family HTH domain